MNESIEIVDKFNKENRYKDGGKINNAIGEVLNMAKWYHSKIDECNCLNALNENLAREIDRLNQNIKDKDEVILKLASRL